MGQSTCQTITHYVLCPFYICNHLAEKEKANCFGYSDIDFVFVCLYFILEFIFLGARVCVALWIKVSGRFRHIPNWK